MTTKEWITKELEPEWIAEAEANAYAAEHAAEQFKLSGRHHKAVIWRVRAAAIRETVALAKKGNSSQDKTAAKKFV